MRSLSKPGCSQSFDLTLSQKKYGLPYELLRHVTKPARLGKIGGKDAQPGMVPWIAAIRKVPRCAFLGEAYVAAATLISKCLLVTAATFFEVKFNTNWGLFLNT